MHVHEDVVDSSPSSPSATSISVNAERPARRYRLPLRLTTPRRTPSRSTTHVPWPGWLRRKLAGRRIRRLGVEIGVDLAAMVGVVAERDRVDARRRTARAAFGVIPNPPATFSPLTTTNVGS